MAAHVAGWGAGNVQGRSTIRTIGSIMTLVALTCPVAVTSGGWRLKRRPKIPAQA